MRTCATEQCGGKAAKGTVCYSCRTRAIRSRNSQVLCACGSPANSSKRGICNRCHRREQTERNAQQQCTCGRPASSQKRGLCTACYAARQRSRNAQQTCACGGPADSLKRGTCNVCWRRRLKYGLSFEDVQQMRERQGLECPICTGHLGPPGNTKADSEVVDHCHATGRVRGLLCNACNKELGVVEANLHRLRAMLDHIGQREKVLAELA